MSVELMSITMFFINRIQLLSFLFTVLTMQICRGQMTLKTTFHMAGIRGSVKFTQVPGGDGVTADWELSGTGSYTWQLHHLYVDFNTEDKCSVINIGERYGTAGGTVNAGISQSTIQGLTTYGIQSIEGLSLMLVRVGDPTVRVCATIKSEENYETAKLHFYNSLFGTVYFRKANDSVSTVIYTDVYFGNSQQAPTEYTWKIYSGRLENCVHDAPIFNPTGTAGSDCSQSNHGNCQVGMMSEKHGSLVVGNIKGSSRRRYTDLNLPLSGENSIVGNTLGLWNSASNEFFCAHIGSLPSRYASGWFSRQGVKGVISFSQQSPFDHTKVEVSLRGLNGLAGGYHIHNFPVPQRGVKKQATCSGSFVSVHLNPFNIVQDDSPAANVGTTDQYEIGDISGKFGGLAGLNDVNITMTDYNMPMYGRNSIIDRSLVIHLASDGSRWVCTNIENMYPVKTAIARFTYPVIGHAVFKETIESWRSDTSIFIELNTADGTTESSMYKWEIHQMKAGSDFTADLGTRCASTWGIYNYQPSDAVVDAEYSQQCSRVDQWRCFQGDLTNKHGQVKVRSSDNTSAEHLFTDSQLTLSGDEGLIGKSIVLLSGTQMIACATIYEVRERVAKVDSWSNGVTGYIIFSQGHGILDHVTKFTNKLSNLGGIAGPYHVHALAIPSNAAYNCSDATVAGHFNPYDIDTTTDPAPTIGTHDQYEAGDLSGKFGSLSGDTDNSANLDSNLELFGTESVVGRSVVLHRATDASRWSCGNLVEDTSLTGGTLYQAKAVFDTHVMGYVIMSQYMYPDGSMSDTTVDVDLWYADGSEPTDNHGWHVHKNSVQGDDQAVTGRCKSTGGHFNPFKVNTEVNYDECDSANPLRCEVGDQGNKLAPFSIGRGRHVYTDVYLPLNGPFSVIGRAVVFHEKDGGSDRFACATLMSIGNTAYMVMTIVTPNTIDRDVIAAGIADSIGAGKWQVMVIEKTSSASGCIDIQVYFMGPNAETLKTTTIKMINEKTLEWGIFTICTSGSINIMSSSVFVMVVWMLGKLM